jgi:3-deoxy-D-manno-octulosonate 8-phosphate phosphatase (KDO 8-P phosphatase)
MKTPISMTSTASHQALQEARGRAREVRWMFFDVDGVMTDGGLFYGPDGESLKRFSVLDGHGLKALKASGVKIAILSGRLHPATTQRAKELRFDLVIQGEERKGEAFDRWAKAEKIDPLHCGHMGDDIPDLELFSRVGFCATVPHAVDAVLARAHWTSARAGGHGAVRECCDFIVESQR